MSTLGSWSVSPGKPCPCGGWMRGDGYYFHQRGCPEKGRQ